MIRHRNYNLFSNSPIAGRQLLHLTLSLCVCVCVSTISQETGRQFAVTQEPFHKPQIPTPLYTLHLLVLGEPVLWGADTPLPPLSKQNPSWYPDTAGCVFVSFKQTQPKTPIQMRAVLQSRLNPFQCQSTFKVYLEPSRRTTFGLSEFTRSTESSLVFTTGQVLCRSPAMQTREEQPSPFRDLGTLLGPSHLVGRQTQQQPPLLARTKVPSP